MSKMSLPISTKRLLSIMAIMAACAIVAIILIYKYTMVNPPFPSVVLPGNDKGIVKEPAAVVANTSHLSSTSFKNVHKVPNGNSAHPSSRPLSLAVEFASTRDNDVVRLAKISQQAISCQARRKVLDEKDSLEQKMAAAKTDSSRAALQDHYAWLLPRIQLAEANTDPQCDAVSDSELDIVARESTLKAAALGDSDSQMCALSVLPEVWAVATDEQRDAITHEVENYLAAGFARGDWRAVHLMQGACSARAGIERLGLPCDGLPTFRLQVLLELGATGKRRKELMDDVSRMIEQAYAPGGLEMQGKTYSRADVDKEAAWAGDEYLKHFKHSSYDYYQRTCAAKYF